MRLLAKIIFLMEVNMSSVAENRVTLFFEISKLLQEDRIKQDAELEKERRERSLMFKLSKFCKLNFKRACHCFFFAYTWATRQGRSD